MMPVLHDCSRLTIENSKQAQKLEQLAVRQSMNEEELSDLPWTIEADMAATMRNMTAEESKDLVIVRYLRSGDTRPLAYWLDEGYCPSVKILKYIAAMLHLNPDASKKSFPFELVAKSRTPKRGRPKKGPEANLRDWLIYKNVEKLMAEMGPGSYDAAISKIADLDGLEISTVKRAYEDMKLIVGAYQEYHSI